MQREEQAKQKYFNVHISAPDALVSSSFSQMSDVVGLKFMSSCVLLRVGTSSQFTREVISLH